jgi:Helix-turn-helix domain
MENSPLTEREAAQYLGLKNHRTLQAWRCQRVGPAYLRLVRGIRYLPKDLDAFLATSRIDPQQQAAAE